ncbi:peptidase S15 [Lophiostoma macrostomum CBS 122681]|uniref:Peptidase S15 n=1 Tax=Lophiostoma macrostomum CBS 122681 TaxID=1314788 RepID=A0A6A6SLL2_9PLEO|nr:peptidase S15 [Lophiostoma macrostomum CBS 122681]
MALPSREDIEFKTKDGVILRGWLYPAQKRGPGIILSAGFNMPKDIVVPDVASWYHKRGFTALIFDTFSIGTSDGEPRGDTNVHRRVEDFIDSVSWLSGNPLVDPEKIVLWGLCFDGNMMLATAATDRRVAAVVAFAPMIDLTGDNERREAILELAMTDLANQQAGNEPMYLPMVDEDGVLPTGHFLGLGFINALEKMGSSIDNRVTVQTYMRALSWSILHLLPMISPTPVLVVTPEKDQVTPVKRQTEAFDMLGEPKEQCFLAGKDHFDWMFGDMDGVFNRQLDFLKRHLKL